MKLKQFFKFLYKYIFISDFRLNNECRLLLWCRKSKYRAVIGFFVARHLKRVRHLGFGKKAKIGKNLFLPHPYNILIGETAVIGNNCIIYHDVTLGQNKWKYPTLGDNVVVYAGAKIIGDVHVGNNVVIGANSVVTHDIPDNAIVGGIPARIIRYRSEEDVFS